MIKPRLSYSKVVATIALVLAVGGGAYAQGDSARTSTSGTFHQTSRTVDVPNDNPTPVKILSVTNFGVLSMSGGSGCSMIPGLVQALLIWRNNTTSSQRISFEREGSYSTSVVAAGQTGTVNQMSRFADQDLFQGEFRVSSYKGKQVVMDVSVAIGGPAGLNCRVTVNSIVSG